MCCTDASWCPRCGCCASSELLSSRLPASGSLSLSEELGAVLSGLQLDVCQPCSIACRIAEHCYAWRGVELIRVLVCQQHILHVLQLFLVAFAVLSWISSGQLCWISLLESGLVWQQCQSQSWKNCNKNQHILPAWDENIRVLDLLHSHRFLWDLRWSKVCLFLRAR